jgi:hypothetical protein
MCWSAKVSLNTFLFSTFTILLAYYNGYNIKLLLAFFSFVLIQLMEYFIWTYLHDATLNGIFSKITSFILAIQPLFLTMYISNHKIQRIYLCIYFIYAFICACLSVLPSNINYTTTVAKNGHLSWNWMKDYIFLTSLYLFFFTAFILEKNYDLFIFCVLTFLFSLYNYFKHNTFGSMWCWSANIISIYILLKILFYDNVPCKYFAN